MEFLHMLKELNGLSDQVPSHWFSMGKSSHAGGPGSEGDVGGAGPNQMKI
jgi:hypothetical protein